MPNGKPNILVIFGDDIGCPPRQGADTLSMHVAIEKAMTVMNSPHGSSN